MKSVNLTPHNRHNFGYSQLKKNCEMKNTNLLSPKAKSSQATLQKENPNQQCPNSASSDNKFKMRRIPIDCGSGGGSSSGSCQSINNNYCTNNNKVNQSSINNRIETEPVPVQNSMSDISIKILNEILNSPIKRQVMSFNKGSINSPVHSSSKNQADFLDGSSIYSSSVYHNNKSLDNFKATDELQNITTKIKEQNDIIENKKAELEYILARISNQSNAIKINSMIEKALQQKFQESKMKYESVHADLQKEKLEKQKIESLVEEKRNQLESIKNLINQQQKNKKNKNNLEQDKQNKENQVYDDFEKKFEDLRKQYNDLSQQYDKFVEIKNLKVEQYNQSLETKAMLKEDLNGKLLQRAELVAQKEDYEQVFDSLVEKCQDEYNYVQEEDKLVILRDQHQQRANSVYQQILGLHERKQNLINQIKQSKTQIMELNKQKDELGKTYQPRFSQLEAQQQQSEIILNQETEKLNIPSIETICQQYMNQLNNNVSTQQIEDYGSCSNKSSILQLQQQSDSTAATNQNTCSGQASSTCGLSHTNSTKTSSFGRQFNMQNSSCKYFEEIESRRSSEIINQLFSRRNSKTQEGDSCSFQNSGGGYGQSDNQKEKSDLKQFLQFVKAEYLDNNKNADVKPYLINFKTYFELQIQIDDGRSEFERQEGVIQSNLQAIIDREDEQKSEVVHLDEQITNLEKLQKQAKETLKQAENQLICLKKNLQIQLTQHAQFAFEEYMQQQQEMFEKISQTYGPESADNLKKDHYEQFMDIMLTNQQNKIDKIKSLQKDIVYYDNVVMDNIKMVDDEILPKLKALVNNISKLKLKLEGLGKEEHQYSEARTKVEREINQFKENLDSTLSAIAANTANESSDILARLEESYGMQNQLLSEINQQQESIRDRCQSIINLQTMENNMKLDIQKMATKKQLIDDIKNQATTIKEETYRREQEIAELKKQIDKLELRKLDLENSMVENRFQLNSSSAMQQQNYFNPSFISNQNNNSNIMESVNLNSSSNTNINFQLGGNNAGGEVSSTKSTSRYLMADIKRKLSNYCAGQQQPQQQQTHQNDNSQSSNNGVLNQCVNNLNKSYNNNQQFMQTSTNQSNSLIKESVNNFKLNTTNTFLGSKTPSSKLNSTLSPKTTLTSSINKLDWNKKFLYK